MPYLHYRRILDKAGITITPTESEPIADNDSDNLFETGESNYDTYSDEELYKMIDEAVKTEDYEKAASIRDEIEKRKKKTR
jgi:excinuclease UvrABC helicase subunit UvrB